MSYQEKLLQAIERGEVETIASLLMEVYPDDLNQLTEDLDTGKVLHSAVSINYVNRLQIVEMLIKHVDVNAAFAEENDKTALMVAFERNDIGMVKLLLSHGADIKNNQDLVKHPLLTELIHASSIKMNQVQLFQDLLSLEPALSVAEVILVMESAVFKNRINLLGMLLHRKVEQQKVAMQAILFVIDCKYDKFLKIIKDCGKNIMEDSERCNMLVNAISHKNIPIVKLILNRKIVDVDEKIFHRTLLNALLHGAELVSCVWDAGAKIPTYQDGPELLDVLFVAIWIAAKMFVGIRPSQILDVRTRKNKDNLSNGSKIIVSYIVEGIAKGRYVEEEKRLDNDVLLKKLKKECQQEFESIKIHKLGETNVTLFGIWNSTYPQLATYLLNQDIVDSLKRDVLYSTFPIYAGRIVKRLEKGFERKFRLKRVCNFFKSLATRKDNQLPQLPATCTRLIFDFLTTEDLIGLRCAYYVKLSF